MPLMITLVHFIMNSEVISTIIPYQKMMALILSTDLRMICIGGTAAASITEWPFFPTYIVSFPNHTGREKEKKPPSPGFGDG